MCSMGDLDWDDDHHYFRVSKIMFHSDWAGVLVGWLGEKYFQITNYLQIWPMLGQIYLCGEKYFSNLVYLIK